MMPLRFHSSQRGPFLSPAAADIIGHELRTPLAYILGYGKLLENDGLGPLTSEQRLAVTNILKGARHLLTFTEQITALLMVQNQTFTLASVDLAKLVGKVVLLLLQRPDHIGHTLSVDLPETLPLITGDVFLLRQMITALLDNAVKFTPPGGQIEVRVFDTGEQVCLAVNDTGIGLARSELSRVFEPFYQVDSSMTRVYGGLGLGLAVVKAVIDKHNGGIHLTSESGQGCQFLIQFPISV